MDQSRLFFGYLRITPLVAAMGRLRPELVESGDIRSQGRCPPRLKMADPRKSAATLAATDATI